MKGGLSGLLIFIGAIAVIAFVDVTRGGSDLAVVESLLRRETVVAGYIGSEKANLLANPEVQRILAEDYGIRVDARRAGSFEMLERSHDGIDFLWPSSQVALEKYRSDFGAPLYDEIIFNSPIVLYSWREIVDALAGAPGGPLITEAAGYAQADLTALVDLIAAGSLWRDLGVPAVFGRFSIRSTDPLQSNSGNMYAGLLANVLAGGVVTGSTLSSVLPDLTEVFRAQGPMESSTGTLFDRYLELGLAQYPLIVGYENQYIEFARENPDLSPDVRGRIALVYPVPTVWSSHPMIALTEDGQRLIEAFADPDLRKIAWTEHGFRNAGIGATSDLAQLGVDRVAPEVTQVIQMPRPDIMFAIMDALEGVN